MTVRDFLADEYGGIALSIRKRAAFFDRDGTINVDKGYVYRTEDLEFVRGVPELIRVFNEKGYLVIVVTNQSGIARGMYSVEQMHHFHDMMNSRLREKFGAHIDAFYYCPHLPEITGACKCRKPEPGLFLRAAEENNIDLSTSVSFGDSGRDEIASKRAGVNQFYYIDEVLKEGSGICNRNY